MSFRHVDCEKAQAQLREAREALDGLCHSPVYLPTTGEHDLLHVTKEAWQAAKKARGPLERDSDG